MAGVNKVIIVGNVGQEPEVRYMPDGKAVATLSIATSDAWKDKQTGEKQERTEWHRVVMFERLAEIAGEYVHKGSKLYVEGKLRTRKWQDQQGIDRYTTEIMVNNIQLLDSRQGDSTAGNTPPQSQQSQRFQQPQQRQQKQPSQGQYRNQGSNQPPVPNFDDFDDDIPF